MAARSKMLKPWPPTKAPAPPSCTIAPTTRSRSTKLRRSEFDFRRRGTRKKTVKARLDNHFTSDLFDRYNVAFKTRTKDYRSRGPAPRDAGDVRSAAMRAAMDVTHVSCGSDGWSHLTAVIDCHDREVTGYEFALRGRAREAGLRERVLKRDCFGCRACGASAPLRKKSLWPPKPTSCQLTNSSI
jgi:transposase InsO family protein